MLASDVERLHDGANMFRVVLEMSRQPAAKRTIHDEAGRVLSHNAEVNARVKTLGTPAFTRMPSRLAEHISEDVQCAIG